MCASANGSPDVIMLPARTACICSLRLSLLKEPMGPFETAASQEISTCRPRKRADSRATRTLINAASCVCQPYQLRLLSLQCQRQQKQHHKAASCLSPVIASEAMYK